MTPSLQQLIREEAAIKYKNDPNNIRLRQGYHAGAEAMAEKMEGENEKLRQHLEKMNEAAQHLFDMRGKKGSTNVMKNAWNILSGRLYDANKYLQSLTNKQE